MWLILPIGHDQGIRHFPWVTVTIAALCLLVQLQGTIGGPSAQELSDAMAEQARLEMEILLPHLKSKIQNARGVPSGPGEMMKKMQEWQKEHATLLAALKAGTLTAKDDPEYLAWLEAKGRVEKVNGRDLATRLAYRPSQPLSLALVLSAFAHGGWLHLVGNLLFLYLVGCNLEDRWGRVAFTGLYLGGAVCSSFAFYLWHRGSETMLIGASGAVAAAMGAFLVCFHNAQIRFLLWSPFRGAQTTDVYAFWVFPFWFAAQLFNSWLEAHLNIGVAYSAHVGGFVFGLALAAVLKLSGIEKRYLLPKTAAGTEWKEDPDYLRALELARAKDLRGAVVALRGVLVRHPRHEGALEQLARTAMTLGEPVLAGKALSAYLDQLGRSRLDQVLPVAHELRVFDRNLPLGDHATVLLFRAAAQANDSDLMIKAANRLLEQHPLSPLGAGVLWEVARTHEKQGRQELARDTLDQLIARYPDDPFAEQARRKLAS